jgi:universal stress protein E
MVALKPWERELPIAAHHMRQLAHGVDAQIEIVGSVFDAAVSAGRDRGEVLAHRAQTRAVAAARAALERLAAPLRAWGARVGTRVVWGVPPYEAILDAAEEWRAELIVVGTHERGALHTRMTDTDWQLIRRARCPLLLVKGAAFSGYRTVLAAVDASNGQEGLDGLDLAVLAAGRSVAGACNSQLRAVYADPGAMGSAPASAAPVRQLGAEDSAAQLRAVERLADRSGIALSAVDVVAAAPARAIVAAAAHRRAELVVVGAGQRCRIAATFIGNTAELVAGELPCDLLVVPVPETRCSVAGARSQVG